MNWDLFNEVTGGGSTVADEPIILDGQPKGRRPLRGPDYVPPVPPPAAPQTAPEPAAAPIEQEPYAAPMPDPSLGSKLYERSWAAAGYDWARRETSPAIKYEWKKGLIEKWKEKGWNISEEDEQNYLNDLDGAPPEAIQQAMKLEQERNKAAIDAQGGIIQVTAKYIADNPGEFAQELAMGIAADPWMLGLPNIYKGALAGLVKAGMNAKAAAIPAVAAEGAVGAGTMALGEAAMTQREEGMVNEGSVKGAAQLGGGLGVLVGGVQAAMTITGRAGKVLSNKTGVKETEHTAEIMLYMQKHRVSLEEATQKVMEMHGVDPTVFLAELKTSSKKLKQDIDEVVPEMKNKVPDEPTDITYPSGGGGVSAGKLASAQRGERTPRPVGRDDGYGLIEDRPARDMSQWTPEGSEPTSVSAGLAADIERIAWKERSAAFPAASKQGNSPADELFTSTAFKPEGAITKPILTLKEFGETSLGKSSTGKPLRGAALQKRYEKFHKDMIEANKDPSMNITMKELADIMSENSATMRKFFLESGRKTGTRANQIPKKFRPGQEGKASAEFMTYLGAAGFAALIGYGANRNPLEAVMYSILATGSLMFGGKVLHAIAKRNPVTKEIVQGKKTVSIDDVLNDHAGKGAVFERELMQRRNAMRLISGESDIHSYKQNRAARSVRTKVTAALEDRTGKKFAALPANGKQLYKYAETMYDEYKKFGLENGILNDAVENYVNHAWQHITRSSSQMVEDLFGMKTKAVAMNTIHKNTRKIPSYAMGKKLGLKPRTEDIAELLTMYMKSMEQAHRSKQMFEALKNTKSPLDKTNLIISDKKAPITYKSINHPKFNGYKVHPDVAPALYSMFGATEFGALYRAALGLNFLLKRQAVSLSGFHAKALIFSSMMANTSFKNLNPLTWYGTGKDFVKLFQGESYALRMFKETADSKVSRDIDQGLRNGLVLNLVDDVGGDTFYQFMDDFAGVFDTSYKGLANKLGGGVVGKTAASPLKAANKTIKGVEHLNKFVDTVMWDRIYTGMKLQTYMNKMEMLTAKFGNKVPIDELSAMAAEFTNDAFGGLNWIRLAQNVESKVGSKIAHGLASRKGRAGMQMSMFAPDWTSSQIRIFYKAFANKNPIQRALYQRYQYVGLLMFGVGADALNQVFSGKHLWENDDMSTIDLGDGRRWSISKQYYEPPKWAWKTEQSILNKLATLPRTALELSMGQEYLRSEGMGPPITSKSLHMLKKLRPIWAGNWANYGTTAGLSSMAGFPMYGRKEQGGLESLESDRDWSGGGREW